MNCKLPPEILNQIFKLIITPYNPPTRDRTLTSLSLVCFNWSSVARRMLFETLRILNRRHCDLVIRGLRQLNDLRYAVLHLGIHFQRMRYIDSQDRPTPAREVHKNMVSITQFNNLIQLVPNILTMNLEYPTFTTLDPISLQLESLTSLTMTIAAYDTNLESLRSLISISPRLKSLNLSRVSSDTKLDPSIAPLPHCPRLKSLRLLNLDILYQTCFFPSDTFIGLESLRILGLQCQDETKEDIPQIFKIAGPTLKLLQFNTDFKYIIKIFPCTSSLKTLDSQIFENPPELYQYFPITLEVSKTISREPELQYFLSHPRPHLRLRHLSILSPSLLKLVPKEIPIESISIFDHDSNSESGSYESIIEELKSDLIPCRKSLKRLEFYGFEDYMFERYQDEIIEEFKELGIEYSYDIIASPDM